VHLLHSQSSGILVSWVLLGFITVVSWLVHVELLAITEKLAKSPYADIVNVEMRKLVFDSTIQEQGPQSDLHVIIKAFFQYQPYAIKTLFICFAVWIIMVLTSYVNVFGTAFGSLWNCDYTSKSMEDAFRIGTVMFGVVLAVLTLVEYKDQKWLQYIMAILQFAVLMFTIIYCTMNGSTEHLSSQNVLASDFLQVFKTFSILTFAYLYHMCIPSVLAAAIGQHREQKEVAIWFAVSVAILYGLTGIISSLFFDNLPDIFSYFFENNLTKRDPNIVLSLFRAFALISIYLPAVDVISVSGIYGQSLAGTFATYFYGTNLHASMINRRYICKLIRVLCVMPPLFCAYFSTQPVYFT